LERSVDEPINAKDAKDAKDARFLEKVFLMLGHWIPSFMKGSISMGSLLVFAAHH
jgi:hypothetical protein